MAWGFNLGPGLVTLGLSNLEACQGRNIDPWVFLGHESSHWLVGGFGGIGLWLVETGGHVLVRGCKAWPIAP